MKKVLKPFIVVFLILCTALLILYQFKDKLGFYNPTVGVRAVFMVQNPETGEYEQSVSALFRISKDKPYTYEPQQREHYDVNEQTSTLYCESANSSTQFTVYYDCQTCTVKFLSEMGELTEGQSEITVRKGQTITNPAKFSCEGYEQVGYDQAVDKVYQDSTFNALWKLKEYSVYLHVSSQCEVEEVGYKASERSKNCYLKAFNFTQGFLLPESICTSSEQIFKGWYTQANGKGERVYEIPEGTVTDVYLYAHYDIITYELNFMLDGESYSTVIDPVGERIYSAGIEAEDQQAGMGLNWYAEEECETLYQFSVMPQGGVTVYGKWESDIGTGFLNWDIEGESIDSYEELQKLVEYTRFNNVTDDQNKLEVTYCSMSQLESDVQLAASGAEYKASGCRTMANFYNVGGSIYLALYMESSNDYEYEQLESTEGNSTSVYNYFGYEQKGRGDFNDFYIESLPNSYKVETTLQLQYVVEHGYKPECKEYSPAQKVYESAKKVLNEIIDLDYTDYQKVQAIYDWLVINVQYDFNALDLEDDWFKYDAHYMEGVFFNQKAVCSGIAKAFSLMCNIEGIPAVEVTGNTHAWCKVKVNNQWYVADPTHGRIHLTDSDKAFVNHGEFLITETEKANKGYTSKDYSQIKANGSYNYFANTYYTYNDETHDLVIESIDEFVNLLLYLDSCESNLYYTQIEIAYKIYDQDIFAAYKNSVLKIKSMGKSFGYQIQVNGNSGNGGMQILFC